MDAQKIDYKKVGFRCGLEIHQQLDGLKLFCKCPTINSDAQATLHAKRRLRAVVGETGMVDAAASHEMAKGKEFRYQSSADDTCLIEFDEEPPLPLSQESLDIALTIALLLNARPVDEVHVMRKLVIDGSNVSGFQRTSLIAQDGWIETSEGRVAIDTVCLEEESAQKLAGDIKTTTYKLDRLGIPLIEIATSASIKGPEHAKEVAAYLGMVLRSVEGVKRGLGTIRQDVNISIEKGARTEVKGFQDLRSIPKVIEFEVKRQEELILNGKKIEKEVRKAEPDFTTSFLRPMPGAARMYPETDVLPVEITQERIARIKKSLPKLRDELVKEFTQKYALAQDVAKVAAEDERFEELVEKFANVAPQIIAQALYTYPKELRSRLNVDPSKITEKDYVEVLGYLDTGKVAKDALLDMLAKKAKGEKIDLAHFAGVSDEELEKEISAIIKEKPNLTPAGYMGLVMAKHRGKIEGKKAMELINKVLKK